MQGDSWGVPQKRLYRLRFNHFIPSKFNKICTLVQVSGKDVNVFIYLCTIGFQLVEFSGLAEMAC